MVAFKFPGVQLAMLGKSHAPRQHSMRWAYLLMDTMTTLHVVPAHYFQVVSGWTSRITLGIRHTGDRMGWHFFVDSTLTETPVWSLK